ncbi:ATP-binding protein [Cellulomonas sp.]|uniref:sensor histidine kinase n=1 Tax=Cellulomonas sp. TaxID=40001 RepID=UPI00258B5C84|nr:ATP-binding protein [Cellulomonas sp.]MCR6688214.1 ATP-binding protein [Cellulomonas sp.]
MLDTTQQRDIAQDRLSFLRGAAIVSLGFGLGSSTQAAYIYSRYVPEWSDVSVWSRVGANVVGVAALVGSLWLMRVYRWRSGWAVLAGVVLGSVALALARLGAQVAFGVYEHPDPSTRRAEFLGGITIGLISAGIGAWAMVFQRRGRVDLRQAEREAVQVELAVRALEDEEIRVRRTVAEGLHGTLQSKLVLVGARLDEVIDGRIDEADVRESLRWVRAELETVRELDVRQMSRLLYPERLELGLVPAVRALLARVPTTIATRVTATDSVREVDDPERGSLTLSQRLLAVRVVEEGLTNALKNGPVTMITVELDLVRDALVVAVENDGPTYDPLIAHAPGGTARLAERVDLAHGTVSLRPRVPRGARLEARLPL